MSPHPTRRDFVSSSARLLGGGWAMLHLPAIASLSACARESAERGEPFATLTPEEGRTMTAFASRIFPSDELPGATEAGAAHFVDGALGGIFEGMLPPVRAGLGALDARAAEAGGPSFADLPIDRQVALMEEVEESEFFFLARLLTIMGVLADPLYGGNRDGAGWELVRLEHRPVFRPPFGYYDAGYTAEEEAD
jgi:gluconate 2-dehydrogenase gamma chain